MGTFATPTTIEYVVATGKPDGRAWCNTSVAYMGFSGVTSAGNIAAMGSYGGAAIDFVASGNSIGVAFNCILSVGGDNFQVAVGGTVVASYVPLGQGSPVGEPVKSTGMGNVTETWTRVS